MSLVKKAAAQRIADVPQGVSGGTQKCIDWINRMKKFGSVQHLDESHLIPFLYYGGGEMRVEIEGEGLCDEGVCSGIRGLIRVPMRDQC